MTTDLSAPSSPPAPLIAPAARYYRMTRYIMVLMIFVFGILFAYDGWIRYPRQNAELADVNAKLEAAHRANDEPKIKELTEQRKQYKPHTDMDLFLQKALGFALPPLAIAFLIWSLYNSRGAYRLEDQTLRVPGHPPVPLDQIRRIDKKLWDRKGIVFIDYELPDGKSGRIKLDDFVYDRPPTDAIFDRIEAYLLPPAEDAAPTEAP
jgi:hypothetical protein